MMYSKASKFYINAVVCVQGRIQDFKLGGSALKKMRRPEGGANFFWGISCQKIIFFPILGGGAGFSYHFANKIEFVNTGYLID